MPDANDDQIRKLLRLKRYEQPPPGYFDDFLKDFHRRQRAELLRRPLWQIAWERLTTFLSEQTSGRYAYGGATALVLAAAAITSMNILESPQSQSQSAGKVAARQPEASRLQPLGHQYVGLHLNPRAQAPHLPELNDITNRAARSTTATLRPRYVMDARPVSYAPSSSF